MRASTKQSSKRSKERSAAKVERAYRPADLSSYPFKERLLIRLADLTFFILIKLIAGTVRFEIEGWENWEAVKSDNHVPILALWHNRIFLATYFWQKRGIVAMTSRSFDGEYIARFMQRFGYGAARGSSTRGAVGALLEMVGLMRAGCPTAFTIDGPKGPRYVAKMGAVVLAKKTGHPILPFTISPARFWRASRSWDQTQVPKLFTPALVVIAPPIYVHADADEAALQGKRDELQQALDAINRRGDEWRRKKDEGMRDEG